MNEPDGNRNSHYFDSLSIRGLGGFELEQCVKLAVPNGKSGSGITAIVGANNTGKSTVVQAFNLVSRSGYHTDALHLPEGRRNSNSVGGVEITLTDLNGAFISLQSIDPHGSAIEWKNSVAFGTDSGIRPDIVVVPSRRSLNAYFHRSYSRERSWQVESDFKRLEARDAFTGRIFRLAEDPEAKRRFDELFQEVVGAELDWTLDYSNQDTHYLKVRSGRSNHDSDGLGEGLISLIFILDALYESEPKSLIVIDEPELSLHPQIVSRLRRVLSKKSADRQIVFATHSPYLIDWEDIEAGSRITRLSKTDASSKIHQPCESTMDSLIRQAKRSVQPYLYGPEAVSSFFAHDGVLLVEGVADARLLPYAFRDLDLELPAHFHGWGMGGADNAHAFARVFHELGFTKLGVLVDSDRQYATKKFHKEFPHFRHWSHPAPDVMNSKHGMPSLMFGDNGTWRVTSGYRKQFEELAAEIGRYFQSFQ